MSKKPKLSSTNVWLAIGAGVLIILLLVWLTVASLTGDTDVAAFIPLPFLDTAGAFLSTIF